MTDTMVFLPQADPDRPSRVQALEQQRSKYQYDYTYLPGLPMVREVPPEDQSFSKFDWIKSVISLLLRLQSNRGMQDVELRGGLCNLIRYIWLASLWDDPKNENSIKRIFARLLPLLRFFARSRDRSPKPSDPSDVAPAMALVNETRVKQLIESVNRPHNPPEREEKLSSLIEGTAADKTPIERLSFRHYQHLFTQYRSLFQIIYPPRNHDRFHEDWMFAAQRVAGPNPLVLERVATLPEKFPLSDSQYRSVMGEADSLARAGEEGRLYLTDYAILDGVKTSRYPEGQKYLQAPLALFAVPAGEGIDRSLKPVAIQCSQTPGPENPIFVAPSPFTPQSEKWAWLIAKTIVQIADGNYHELISHLGRTHLWMEPFAMATERQLAPNHPLSLLLRPHFEGTLFINDSALKGLINPGGTVDAVMAGELKESIALAAKAVQGYPFDFNNSMLPRTLAARGVDDPAKLPDYPYRDDALSLWEAIREWVANYIGLYYRTDTDVREDFELQNWLIELMSEQGGRLTGIGEVDPENNRVSIRSRDYLIDAVTLIIFTGSAQHAAVNFTQGTFMTYGPNMPLAGYRPAPTSTDGATVQDYFDLLPSLAQAEKQMNMTYPLASVYYTRLGDYGDGYFSDERVNVPLETFQQKLEEIAILIEGRNATRPTYYDFLHPARIPQSINI